VNSFEKIYEIVAKIPKGKVLTYKKVAQIVGINPKASGPRVVGFAIHANKDIIKVPCHRVVGSNGKLTGYARGGIKEKRRIYFNFTSLISLCNSFFRSSAVFLIFSSILSTF